MLGIVFIAAAGIFVIGIVVGVMAMVSHGIHREERQFQEERRFRVQHGIWTGPEAPDYFMDEQAPDGVSTAARRLNGLYVRHMPTVGREAELSVPV